MNSIQHFVDGKIFKGKSNRIGKVFNPATGEQISEVSLAATDDVNTAVSLAKKALIKDPKYVEYNFRKEQLWGEKLQSSTKQLFQNSQLIKAVNLAKTQIPEAS